MKHLRVLLGLLTFLSSPAWAQTWPNGPVKIIVPFAVGSTPDIVARTLAEAFQQKFNQPFTIENKPGSSGNLGTGLVAKAAPDGGTLGVTIGAPLTVNSVLFPELPYDPSKDIAPITILTSQPSVLVVNAKLGIDSVEGLVAAFKKDPNQFNYGSIGTGSLSHLAMELFAMKSNGRPVHIPYSGSREVVQAIISGEVHLGCVPAFTVAAYSNNGPLKMLAVTTPQRSPLLPNLPTLKEMGVLDVEADAWIGLVAPGGTDEAVIAKIHEAATAVLADPQVRNMLKGRYMRPVGNTPAEFRAFLKEELNRWMPVIRAGNIRLN